MRGTYLTENPARFADKLDEHGMGTKRATAVAYNEAGYDRDTIADKMGGISRQTVASHLRHAKEDKVNAATLNALLNTPDYINEIDTGVAETTYEHIDHTIAFSLLRPAKTDADTDATYTLRNAIVVEGYYVNDDYLLVKQAPGERETFWSVDGSRIAHAIIDWFLPGRFAMEGGHSRQSADAYADRWFLMDVFEPEALIDELADVGVERIQAITDDDFVDPLTTPGVRVRDGAHTGRTVGGYEVGYSPTAEELKAAVREGSVSPADAAEMSRESVDVFEGVAP